MFKSQLSGKQYPKGVKPVRVVVETRNVSYLPNNTTQQSGVITLGSEIVREVVIGPDEAAELSKQ